MSKRNQVAVKLYGPHKNKPAWRVVWRDPAQPGKRVFWSFPDKDSAMAAYQERLDYVLAAPAAVPGAPRLGRRSGPHTMAELFDEQKATWKVAGTAASTLRHYQSLYNTWVGPALGATDVRAWATSARYSNAVFDAAFAAGRSPATVLGISRLLRTMLSQAHELGWAPAKANPLDRRHRHRGLVGAGRALVRPEAMPTTAQADALARALDAIGAKRGLPALGLMCRVASRGGLRFGEQVALQAASLTDHRTVWVTHSYQQLRGSRPVLAPTKNRQEREVPVPASVWQDLEARAKEVAADQGPEGLLFPGPGGPGQPWTDSEFRRVFQAAARAAGWPMAPGPAGAPGRPLLPYKNLRHHAATWMFEVAHYRWADISRYLGHHSTSFTHDHYERSEHGADDQNRLKGDDL